MSMSNLLNAVSTQASNVINFITTTAVNLGSGAKSLAGRAVGAVTPTLSAGVAKVQGIFQGVKVPAFVATAYNKVASFPGINVVLLVAGVGALALATRVESRASKVGLYILGGAAVTASAVACTLPFLKKA